ncbi:potassium channel, subfamily K, member 13-like [Halichoeres trimaculatus]|uniref:potassium channel, subfamily K, member 13-like n=1 Tax=Halichoeres trimaculatus TaxID=147232 RepID=UPI003D9EEBA2
MMRDFSCCCPTLIPSRETARFYLLFVLIALYMLAGAAIFSSLERPAELQAHKLWETRLKDFSKDHNVSCEDLKSLLRQYEEARTAGIRTERGRALWDIPGAFYFVGTVVSTIGFGVTAPSTVTGKILLVFYGLLGCSAAILFFNLFLERVITLLSFLILWCQRQRKGPDRLDSRTSDLISSEEWKPSVYQVTLILFVAVLLVACGAASLYSAMEGWSYLESLYFCFVAFSTVGFGDFVSGQRKHHEDTEGYKVANCLVMLLGVCCTYSLFNAISVIIMQGLNWMLRTLAWMCSSIGLKVGLKIRPLFKLCFSDSESPLCYCENDAQHRQQVQAISSSGHSMLWRSCVPNSIGKCLCDEAKVEKVRSMKRETSVKQEQEHSSYGENQIYASPLPSQAKKIPTSVVFPRDQATRGVVQMLLYSYQKCVRHLCQVHIYDNSTSNSQKEAIRTDLQENTNSI